MKNVHLAGCEAFDVQLKDGGPPKLNTGTGRYPSGLADLVSICHRYSKDINDKSTHGPHYEEVSAVRAHLKNARQYTKKLIQYK